MKALKKRIKELEKTKRWTRAKKNAYLSALCSAASWGWQNGKFKNEDEEDFLLFHGVHLGGIRCTEKRLENLGVVLPWEKKETKRRSSPRLRRSSPRLRRSSPRLVSV